MQTSWSMMTLILHAGGVVKCVMLLLLLLSIVSWAFIIRKAVLLRQANKSQLRFERSFWSGGEVRTLYEDLRRSSSLEGLDTIFVKGFSEFIRMKQDGAHEAAIMEGSIRAMSVAQQKELQRLEQQLPLLATISSVSPFIGLFGTVWGIMHAFIALGGVQQASLAMVAPGIAEALIATAMGLFTAIPAMVAYNRFNHRVDELLCSYQTFCDEFTNLLHRKLYAKGNSEDE